MNNHLFDIIVDRYSCTSKWMIGTEVRFHTLPYHDRTRQFLARSFLGGYELYYGCNVVATVIAHVAPRMRSRHALFTGRWTWCGGTRGFIRSARHHTDARPAHPGIGKCFPETPRPGAFLCGHAVASFRSPLSVSPRAPKRQDSARIQGTAERVDHTHLVRCERQEDVPRRIVRSACACSNAAWNQLMPHVREFDLSF